jgi:stearoyl-CoA desaturase (delta-9 desaturase)
MWRTAAAAGRLFAGLGRRVNLLVVIIPPLGVVLAMVLLWNDGAGWSDVAILLLMYTATTLGITAGFHRLLTHRSFETSPAMRNALAVLGSMAVENPVIIWVADHRQHHAFADEEGDPHSPHTHGGSGLRGTLRGLWHAHVGWLLSAERKSNPIRYAPDLLKEPAMREISRLFLPLVFVGLLIPFGLGVAVTGTLSGGLTGMLWGGLVRIFLQHHMTFSVNSIGHFHGKRLFDIPDKSTNVFWLSVPSFGDSWHHNHHAFPTSARHGFTARQVDMSWWFIRALERLGLAWNVKAGPSEQALARKLGRSSAPERELRASST